MDDYIIVFTRSARKELERLDKTTANKIFNKIENLAKDIPFRM